VVKPAYRDILAVAGDRPVRWWDDNGVPRYAPFTPDMLGVYDNYAGLFEIECQSAYCNQTFLVGAGGQRFNLAHGAADVVETSLEWFITGYDYGDPPRHNLADGGRCAGETMRSNMVRVIQAWERTNLAWVRRPELEQPLEAEPPVPGENTPA
jgi:hypothetical protein